jgi:hypothetical protein
MSAIVPSLTQRELHAATSAASAISVLSEQLGIEEIARRVYEDARGASSLSLVVMLPWEELSGLDKSELIDRALHGAPGYMLPTVPADW